MLGLSIILLALGALMVLAYRGLSILVVAPATAVLAAYLAAGDAPLAVFTQIYMPRLGGFVVAFLPLFLLGAIFGRLMEETGAAQRLAAAISGWLGAGRAILATVLCAALLTYGGVSLFVVAFAVYPIAVALFRRADVPKRLIPAALSLGAFTFTMSALPGTPAIQNAIPMPHFGTTPFAAPGLGTLAGLAMAGLGLAWLGLRHRQAVRAGEGYGAHKTEAEAPTQTIAGPRLPLWAAVLPIATVLGANLLALSLFPFLDTGYLAEPRFGETTIAAVRGLWAVTAALTAAILLLMALAGRRLPRPAKTLSAGAEASLVPLANTASLVGFGAVVAGLPAFQTVSAALMGLSEWNLLVSLAVSVNVLSAITGSASGGMSIALEALGPTYVALGAERGVSPEAMHRVAAISSGALDALPHNGAVVTVLGICGLTHQEAYGDIFMVAVIGPLLALAGILALAAVFGGF